MSNAGSNRSRALILLCFTRGACRRWCVQVGLGLTEVGRRYRLRCEDVAGARTRSRYTRVACDCEVRKNRDSKLAFTVAERSVYVQELFSRNFQLAPARVAIGVYDFGRTVGGIA